MNWIIITLLLLVILYLWNRNTQLKKQKTIYRYFLNNWMNDSKSDNYEMAKIKRYKKNYKTSSTIYQKIGKQTNKDLDLDEVFKSIDFTITPIGKQYLYYKLHNIEHPTIDNSLSPLEEVFTHDSNLRTKTLIALNSINHKDTYYFEQLFTNPPQEKRTFLAYAKMINIVTIVILFTSLFYSPILLAIVPILSINAIIHYKNKIKLFELQSAIKQFTKIYNSYSYLVSVLALKKYNAFKESIPALKKIKSLSSFLDSERKMDNEIATLIWLPIEWLKILFNVEYIVFHSLLTKLEHNKKDLHELYIAIGKIDLALSLVKLKALRQTSAPHFTLDKEIDVKDIYHPLIENCVKNDLNLVNNSLLLTGSNMSGKTTFIRTFVINALLAQTLGFTFSKSYRAPFYKIHTSIKISDDLSSNKSFYLQEVSIIKRFIKQISSKQMNLIVLDEILKGTNTIERISASAAILNYLNTHKDTIMVSTHDLELIDLLQNNNYTIAHFKEEIIEDKLSFDYTLNYGVPTTTNALRILEINSYPKEIIIQANDIKKMFS
ncbi:MutS-related protein [Myroides injenensis]|uniref:MutS-related protein n=1 Tax=Myroides injenensis TaxID=1183151 RepID=UPI00227203CE|nr:hypothetical protein [Myroides injenensis]